MSPRLPRERCLVVLECRRLLAELWAEASTEHERMLLENVQVTLRAYLQDLCKRYKLPEL